MSHPPAAPDDDTLTLVYVADPMCSWCYGFGRELDALRAALDERGLAVPLNVVLGGLRPYTREPLPAAQRQEIRRHWNQVQQTSGLPFDDRTLMRPDFIYDTEPACRAVVTARSVDRALALPMLHAIQHAFYAEGRDVTQAEVLGDLFATTVLPGPASDDARASFLAAWDTQNAREATRGDFELVQQWGVQGFPLLLLLAGEHQQLLTYGYSDCATMLARASETLAS
jgi:putative protein-disulfide isomerase